MRKTILMIDDDVELSRAVGRYVELKGWEFDSTAEPEEAVGKARSVHPDLILLDVNFPNTTGWNVCRTIKSDELARQVPVIMLSGARMSPEDKALGLEVGADDYLTKPVDLELLLLKAEAILRVGGR
ncbi:MAG: response regulator [Elusimicrobiota bacterium]|jgi:DNA-binding response OmpR family regulator